ncbi:MAG: sensor histidine kinase [Egibacteraceae bacterium]
MLGLIFAASALAVVVISGALGIGGRRGVLVPAAAAGLVLVLVAVAVIGRSVRRMAAPIGEVMEAAERVAAGDYRARVMRRGPWETRRLAGAFNTMVERLESNERRRRDLLADIAHELRTPLSVIRGNVEAMRDGVYPRDEAGLARVLEETAVMSRLLDDLQLLSTAEAGALKLYREPVAPSALVEDAVAGFRAAAQAEQVRLSSRVAPGLPSLDVDPVRIGEVLSNLLSNALRHTPPGGAVEIVAAPCDGGVALTVSDTGAGIPAAEAAHIFDRFVKSADSGGAGLGLAIAKTLVEAHAGRITVDSEPGRGTTMRVLLPVEA